MGLRYDRLFVVDKSRRKMECRLDGKLYVGFFWVACKFDESKLTSPWKVICIECNEWEA